MIHKSFMPTDLKMGSAGHLEAAFSVYGNVDADGDIVMPGSIPNGAEISISAWNHGSWQPGVLPIGRGIVRSTKDAAVVEATMFDTTAARDTMAVLSGLGGLSRWSFAFQILDEDTVVSEGRRVRLLKALQVHEASPVLVPANPATRTLSVSAGDDDPEAVATAEARLMRLAFERALADEMTGIRAGLGLDGAA